MFFFILVGGLCGTRVGQDDLDLRCRNEVARRAVAVVDFTLDGHVGFVERNGQDDIRNAGHVVCTHFHHRNGSASCRVTLLGNVEDIGSDVVLFVGDKAFLVGIAGFVFELGLYLGRVDGLV